MAFLAKPVDFSHSVHGVVFRGRSLFIGDKATFFFFRLNKRQKETSESPILLAISIFLYPLRRSFKNLNQFSHLDSKNIANVIFH